MFFDVLEVFGLPCNDSEWILDHSFFHHFLTFFVIFFLPLLHKIFSFNLTKIILRLGISSLLYFRMPFLILTKVNGKLLRNLKFGSGLKPFPEIEEIPNSVHVRNYSLSRSALRVICDTCGIFTDLLRGPSPGNTCASMENLRILGPKPHQTDEFWDDFFNFFRSLWVIENDCFGCFLMFLRSLDHPGMILDGFWIIHFFIIF